MTYATREPSAAPRDKKADVGVESEAESPDSPADLPSSSLKDVLARARAEFRRDHLTDLAAGLTYYATLSAIPALIVLVAVLGLLGPDTTRQVTEQIQAIAPGSSAQFVSNLIGQAQSNR